MAGPWNLQGPAVDFSPLGNLYANFTAAQNQAIKRKQEEEAGPLFEQLLASMGNGQQAAQPGSLSALAAQAQGGATPRAPSFASGTGYAAELPVKSADQIKRASDYGSYLTKQGENPNVAAGLIGNAWHESGGLSSTVRGDNGASIGLFQFHEKGRQPALRQWAAQTGRDVNDPYAQLDFVRHDLQANFPQTYAKMQAARDPGEATRIFMSEYERPAASAAYLDRRLARANQAYGLLNQQTAAVAPGFNPQIPPAAAGPGPAPMQVAAIPPAPVPRGGYMARDGAGNPIAVDADGNSILNTQAAQRPTQVAQTMPTQPQGNPTTGFNTPIGQDVYAQGFNAPLNTAVPLGRPQPQPTTQVAAADPRADLPSPNAQEAAFYVPGSQSAPAGQAAPMSAPAAPAAPAPVPAAPAMAPAAALGAGGMTPQFRAALGAALRNPETRQAAMALWQNAVKPGEYGFQKLDDGTIVRTNPRTGAVEPVYQAQAKPDLDVKEVNGRLIAFDKRTQTSRDVTPEGMPPGARPMTPDEKVKYNISADTGAFFDAKGVPHTLGPTTQVNIDQKAESKFESTMAEGAAKRWNTYIDNSDKAQAAMGDIGNLRALSSKLGSQGSTAAVKATLGPYAESLGINLEGLSDIQAYESVIQRLAPQMHVAGSGATSDIEFKGMLKALPGLSAHPEARNAIMDTMEAQAQYAMQRGDIARDLQDKTITRPEAEKRIRGLGDPMTAFKEWRKANPDVYGSALKGGGSTTQPGPSRLPQGVTVESARSEAANAIKNGTDRNAVIRRLKEWGVDASGL